MKTLAVLLSCVVLSASLTGDARSDPFTTYFGKNTINKISACAVANKKLSKSKRLAKGRITDQHHLNWRDTYYTASCAAIFPQFRSKAQSYRAKYAKTKRQLLAVASCPYERETANRRAGADRQLVDKLKRAPRDHALKWCSSTIGKLWRIRKPGRIPYHAAGN